MSARLGRAALAIALATIGCHCKKTADSAEVAPVSQPSASSPFPGAPDPSYGSAYGSSLRSSRVAVRPRRYEGLHSVPVAWPNNIYGPVTPEKERVTPRFVLVPPDGQHLAVDWGARFDLRDAKGTCLHFDKKAPGYTLSAADGAFFIYGNEAAWSGESPNSPKVLGGYSNEGGTLAMRYQGDRRVYISTSSPDAPHGGGSWSLTVYQDRFTSPERTASDLVALNGFDGRGVAAIAGDLRSVVAVEDRTLAVLAAHGDPATDIAPALAKRTLPYGVRLLSIAPPSLLLVGDDGGPNGTLHALDAGLAEVWSAALPIAPGEEPPIDGGGGRVVVVGNGIASLEQGRVLWSAPSAVPLLATAFEDGTLAVAKGSELELVDRDGTIRQSLHAGAGESITTPPAIAADGAVWVATTKAIYVAR
jgi:hypothetical protein